SPAGALCRKLLGPPPSRFDRFEAFKPAGPNRRPISPSTAGTQKLANEVTVVRVIPACVAIQSVTALALPPRAKSTSDRPVLARFVNPCGLDSSDRSTDVRLFLRIR